LWTLALPLEAEDFDFVAMYINSSGGPDYYCLTSCVRRVSQHACFRWEILRQWRRSKLRFTGQ
jgi:hypothetical protein